MEPEEFDSGSGDMVTGLDALLINIGVAIMAIPVTFFVLVTAPSRLSERLTANVDKDETHNSGYLGPGLFFVLSFLSFVLVMLFLRHTGSPSVEAADMPSETHLSAGYNAGYALAHLIKSFEDRLASGNIWSAIIIAIPFYCYAIGFSIALRLIAGAGREEWTAAHSVGASLYVTGGLACWAALAVGIGVVISPMMPSAGGGLFGITVFLVALGMTVRQIYMFIVSVTGLKNFRSVAAALMTPVMLVSLMAAVAVLLT